jgi:hypothetical protein
MRKLIGLAVLLIALPLVGCNSEPEAPQDDSFQKGLAEAATKNTGPNPGERGGGAKVDDATKQGSAPPAGDK